MNTTSSIPVMCVTPLNREVRARSWLAAFSIWLSSGLVLVGQSIIQFPARYSPQANEGSGSALVSVERTDALETVVTVDFATNDDTAIAGEDYLATSGTVTFAAGETHQVISIPILNDGLVEGDERFLVTLSNPGPGAVLGTRITAAVRIIDNDIGLQFELDRYSANEDAGAVTVRVLRRDDGGHPVSVDYLTSNLSAVEGEDYLEASGTLSFDAGETIKYLTVTLLNDAVRESAKNFRITLSNPSNGAVLGTPAAAVVIIQDTDELVEFQTVSVRVPEDAAFARVAVVRGESEVASTVLVATADIEAIAGQDYTELMDTLYFAPGERLKYVDVPLLNDGLLELTKRFRITLSDPTGGAVLGARRTATMTILDNDPGVGFESKAVDAWAHLPTLTLTVVRGNDGWLEPFRVDYQTVDGTAQAGIDYETAAGTLSFAANERVKSLAVNLMQDSAPDASKYFTVTLTNLTGQIPMGTSSSRVRLLDGSQMNLALVQPMTLGAIENTDDWIQVFWQGSAVLSRAHSATGPWEAVGTVDSPFVTTPESPGAFYGLKSSRSARVHVPSRYDGQTPLPLVVVLHGYGGNAGWMEGYFQFQPAAESRGVFLCYPEGTPDSVGARYWNATDACCDFYGGGVDDSAYLRGLVEIIAHRFVIDRKRIYFTGLSNGGFMSYRMACDHADLVAAIAPFAGVTFLDAASRRPTEPVHVLHIHGTADETVPYDGGALYGLPVTALFPGAMATVQTWAWLNECQDPVLEPAPSLGLTSGVALDTTVMRYTSAPPGGEVELWTIQMGRHVPTLSGEFPERVIDWLLAHPKP